MHSPAWLLSALLSLAAVRAQDAPPPHEAKPAREVPFVFEAGSVELQTLIQRCGAYLQRNILVDDAELGGGRKQKQGAAAPAIEGPFVELQLPVVTDRNGCEELLTSLLWSRGLTLVPLDERKGVYEVLALAGGRSREILLRAVMRSPEQVLARPTLRTFVMVVCPLQHTNSNIASNALRPFFATSGNSNLPGLTIGTAGNTTSLLLSGPQDQVASALLLLQTADVPQPAEAQPELQQRIDALTKQQGQLLQRIAALEAKLEKKN